MKKIVVGILIVLSSFLFGKDSDDRLERELQRDFPVLTDGRENLRVSEYDIDFESGYTKVEIKISERDGETIFRRMNSSKLEEQILKIVSQVRREMKNSNPVRVEIETERRDSDKKLYYKVF